MAAAPPPELARLSPFTSNSNLQEACGWKSSGPRFNMIKMGSFGERAGEKIIKEGGLEPWSSQNVGPLAQPWPFYGNGVVLGIDVDRMLAAIFCITELSQKHSFCYA